MGVWVGQRTAKAEAGPRTRNFGASRLHTRSRGEGSDKAKAVRCGRLLIL